jgi:Uma2 family endonuclease
MLDLRLVVATAPQKVENAKQVGRGPQAKDDFGEYPVTQAVAVKLPPTTQEAEGLPRRRWTVAELERMTEAGILPEDERLELIGGEVVPMSPKGIRHEVLKTNLVIGWARKLPDDLLLTPETTFRLSEDTYIEPDVLVYRQEDGLLGLRGEIALLAVEVADSSLAYDMGRKAAVYARFGVREMWVIDAVRLTVRIHRDPDTELRVYRQISDHGPEETLVPQFASALTLRLADFERR